MTLGNELVEDLRRQGALEEARRIVLMVFDARFGDAPDAVRAAIAKTEDRERLRTWLRGVVCARDGTEAVDLIREAR